MAQNLLMDNVCSGCGHRRVCHRSGPCEFVKRVGWIPSRSCFTSEEPCFCKAWTDTPVKGKTKPR